MDDRPRNLKEMLSEAKDTSELMVDLGYAALFFADDRMADEVDELEERLNELVHEMREVCVLAGRSKRDAEQIAGVLHVVSAIERMGNAAVDISRVVTHRLGIPAVLVADLGCGRGGVAPCARARRVAPRGPQARRGRPPDGRRHAHRRDPARARVDHSIPTAKTSCSPTTCSSCAAHAKASPSCASSPARRHGSPAALEENPAISDLDRAVDVLVEMKNVSEAAVGLAYSALLFERPVASRPR